MAKTRRLKLTGRAGMIEELRKAGLGEAKVLWTGECPDTAKALSTIIGIECPTTVSLCGETPTFFLMCNNERTTIVMKLEQKGEMAEDLSVTMGVTPMIFRTRKASDPAPPRMNWTEDMIVPVCDLFNEATLRHLLPVVRSAYAVH